MNRRTVALLSLGLFVAAYFTMATESVSSWSDGTAGSSGSIPIHLRKCTPPFKYCKVKVSGCGGCHGDWEAMQYQKNTEQPVVDRINAEVWIGGDKDKWEYEPGRSYVLDVYIYTKRPPGTYNKAAFDLNTSAGKFELFAGDDTLRITGGSFQHAGSKNAAAKLCNPSNPTECQQYGATKDDEKNASGELTNTGKGSNASTIKTSNGYHWRAKWVAPAKQDPHGVAFVMSFMVPNSDGVDSCTWVECNSTKGYSDQNLWDWWSFMIPRKIVCEKGQNKQRCNEAVLDFILPPAPPVNTSAPNGSGGSNGSVTPALPGESWVALLLAAGLAVRRRRPR